MYEILNRLKINCKEEFIEFLHFYVFIGFRENVFLLRSLPV